MKKSAVLIFLVWMLFLLAGCVHDPATPAPVISAPPTVTSGEPMPENRIVRLCAAEAFADSGLPALLKAQFEAQSPYRLEILPNVNNTAVSVAAAGKAELLVVQQNAAVSQFLSAGYGTAYPFVRDSYVLLGPADDPANVQNTENISEALVSIAKTGSSFVSRYDDSDTNKAETALWKKAGIVIGNGRKWYIPSRLGMTAALHLADTEGAYILSEKTAYLQEKESLSLDLYYDAQPELIHSYVLVVVSADNFEALNSDGTAAFTRWLMQDSTKELIRSYGTDDYGCPIFETEDYQISEYGGQENG